MKPARLVMIGIDAAEHTVIDSMIARGRLPTLARLRRNGTSGLLESPADIYSGAVWPTFYTGQQVPSHGVYHNKLWQPARMCCMVPDEHLYTARPFWESFAADQLRTCVVDVPLVLGKAQHVNGIYLGGWATHDPMVTGTSPTHLWRDLQREFGRRAMPPENFGQQDSAELLQLCGDLLKATEQLQRVSLSLLQRESWDFTCIVFGAAHRAGHYLWDLTQALDADSLHAAQRTALVAAVERIYEAIDHAVGSLLDAVTDVRVIVFSLHGMGPNSGWSELVPEMLDARRAALAMRAVRKGGLYRLQRALVSKARPVLQLIPPRLTSLLVPVWSSRMFDWNSTRFFPLPMDLTAFIRINMRGRERAGIVEPGEEYRALCEEVETFFHSLRVAGTDTRVVADIVRTYEQACASAPHRDGQPDLVVRWSTLRTHEVPLLSSTELPKFQFQVPRWLRSGRSGNHLKFGWFVASGPDIAAGVTVPPHDILDLAPTARHLLGLERDASMYGRLLPLVAAG